MDSVSCSPNLQLKTQPSCTMTSRILAVEDNFILLKLIKALLRAKGYECFGVSNGQEALEWLGVHRADVIVTDLEMPVMGGLDLLEQLQKIQASPKPSIIVLSGTPDQRMWDKAIQLGASAVLTKPYENDDLLRAIQLVLENSSEG